MSDEWICLEESQAQMLNRFTHCLWVGWVGLVGLGVVGRKKEGKEELWNGNRIFLDADPELHLRHQTPSKRMQQSTTFFPSTFPSKHISLSGLHLNLSRIPSANPVLFTLLLHLHPPLLIATLAHVCTGVS